ncbi:MAG: hypothetical protein H0T46_24020 [Deltaproteobacteria bacterium]|nr:hypothetical protein [Deltaproteobacteria bacterium]
MSTRFACIAALTISATACSDDPVKYSQPVGINLKAKSSDTTNNTVSNDKGINTESGNPYGAFISAAKNELGGADPKVIEIEKVQLFLGGSSTNVTRLGEVFDGTVDIVFVINDTNNSYPAASGPVPAATGAGPIELDPSFNSDALPDFDYQKLLGGGFKVVMRGPAASGFMAKGAEADIQATFTFAAYE